MLVLFLPRGRRPRHESEALVERALCDEQLGVAAWRPVPVEPSALGAEARASLPFIAQAVVTPVASGALSVPELERRLLLARRRMELGAESRGIPGFSVASASSRTVVYKGLVAGEELGRFYPDLAAPLSLSYAVFHQRYATNTRPRWALAQPFRLLAHNGEINTVRGNREQLRGRAAALGGSFGRRVAELGPLLSEDASDSLSLDETVDLMIAAGWPLDSALLAAIPEALSLRTTPHRAVQEFQRRTAGLLAPWDGPAALVFSDGRRVGALLDRNGLRPAAYTITSGGLVALASEAGAVPIPATETVERGRLGPGEMLVVDPARGAILHDAEAKQEALRRYRRFDAPRAVHADAPTVPARRSGAALRWTAGLDAERLRLSVRTMALEGHEPLWSMGDDTPTPALARRDRPVTDHLRQSFAQVTNPAIDPERERIVMDLGVELGRRARLLEGPPRTLTTVSLRSPVVADPAGLTEAFRRARGDRSVATLDATWAPSNGLDALDDALARLVVEGLRAARRGAELIVLDDRHAALGTTRAPVPSVLAAGALHSALTDAGIRGQTDILVVASDLLDVHALAMALAAGATAVSPWLAVELAGEVSGGRGAEDLTPEGAIANLLGAFEKGLRKTLARMGISTVASYVGGQFFEALELAREVLDRCFPAAPSWPGTVTLRQLAARQTRRLEEAAALSGGDRLPDPGFARYRGDGEFHLYSPATAKALQALASDGSADARTTYRLALARPPAVVRDQLRIRRSRNAVPLEEVEPAPAIMRRFVSAAMSLGSLSPEAHQTITLGMRLVGGASNTGEGGEDPTWYDDRGGQRRDAAIKQVASARFGVTATYLARGEQLEIKIAQGSKPGEGGQLPGRKATPVIAALRRAQPGQSLISPPPHHDIYSIEDLAQLIADLRAIAPGARIGVKLVAALGVGTIAAGVAKAGADYVQISGHSGGTGASPLSSIKHAGVSWELGLAEAHAVLLRNRLRDRVALRTDGGIQTGRDVLVAALLGAEEYVFGTAALVAVGCDMARQCHLDTCPTGIATQREDLRAKFTGTPGHVERFFRAIAEDTRRELSMTGFRTIGEALGETAHIRPASTTTLDLSHLRRLGRWNADARRRSSPAGAQEVVQRKPASEVEARLARELLHLPEVRVENGPPYLEHADHPVEEHPGEPAAVITNADRSFGAHVTGLVERGLVRRGVDWTVTGSAGQSFGAFAGPSLRLELVGQANDYVAKGLSGGRIIVRPEPALEESGEVLAIAGNTCLYGATAGRLHLIGRAGMRFAVRNSGAEAVVEGVGAHGCEYMTGGIVVILGPVGRNLGAGMTGGRVYVHDATGETVSALDASSVRATRLSTVVAEREDGLALLHDLRRLLLEHRDAGSRRARALLEETPRLAGDVWLIEPVSADASPLASPLGASETTGVLSPPV